MSASRMRASSSWRCPASLKTGRTTVTSTEGVAGSMEASGRISVPLSAEPRVGVASRRPMEQPNEPDEDHDDRYAGMVEHSTEDSDRRSRRVKRPRRSDAAESDVEVDEVDEVPRPEVPSE